jgi:hypothetical protein
MKEAEIGFEMSEIWLLNACSVFCSQLGAQFQTAGRDHVRHKFRAIRRAEVDIRRCRADAAKSIGEGASFPTRESDDKAYNSSSHYRDLVSGAYYGRHLVSVVR